jgi:type IV secretory pathway TraG/TraD family ATPase VirD4
VLDPFGVSGQPGGAFNPMDGLDPHGLDVAEDAAVLAEALVYDPPGQAGDAHWNEEAKALIAGVILHVVTSEPPDRRNLATVREHLTAAPTAFKRLSTTWPRPRPQAGSSRAPPIASSESPTAKPRACCRPRNATPTSSIVRA